MLMNFTRTSFTRMATQLVVVVVTISLGASAAQAQWKQWGGPDRNFMVQSAGLADSWPEDGPKQLWKRELGDGYATVLADGDTLYTMYRTDDTEYSVALDAKTGATKWEHANESPFTDLMKRFGPGPSSTPLIHGDALFTIGTNMVLHCFDKKTGTVRWKHDLVAEFGAKVPGRGYCASPIAHKDTVIVAVGRVEEDEEGDDGDEAEAEKAGDDDDDADGQAKGPQKATKGQALIAFDVKTGSPVWKSLDYVVSHSSPILIDFGGREQVVLLGSEFMIGADPDNGALLWDHKLEPAGVNLSTPLWTGDGLLFCSSAYDSGSRVIKLQQKDGKTVPQEVWYGRKMRIHHGNPVRIGDYVYASSGDFGPAFIGAVNILTGKVVWRQRGFTKATMVYADGKLIILDEDGQLALATASPDGLKVISKCTIGERYAWACPTLVGTTLYVRDRKHIMAFDLGSS